MPPKIPGVWGQRPQVRFSRMNLLCHVQGLHGCGRLRHDARAQGCLREILPVQGLGELPASLGQRRRRGRHGGQVDREDGAGDDRTLKDFFRNEWGIELPAPINPRRRGPITKDLPRGVDHITPTGTPVCGEGYPFEFVTCRHDTEKFVFEAPRGEDGIPVCWACPQRTACYRGNAGSRRVTIAFERLPWLDPEFTQVSKRFAKIMARRTVIERLHKLMKYDYGDERLSKRGTKAFQARLDKTLLAMHLALAHGG